MQNKLQELTDKLYNEGLSKGKKEAEELKSAAAMESEKILSDARKQAAKILENARKESEEIKIRVQNDLKMASSQTIAAVKQEAEKLIITNAVTPAVKQGMEDAEFIKSIITTLAKGFNASDAAAQGLEAILPESMQKELEEFFRNKAVEVLGKGVETTYSKQLAGGFKIGPKNGGYMISFAENDFENTLIEYLRPATKKLLFG